MGSLGHASHVARVVLGFTPLRDIVAPPFTSKVVKFYLERAAPPVLAELHRVRRGFKGLSVSPLFIDGRPLFRVVDGAGPLVLRRGVRYVAWVSAMVPSDLLADIIGIDSVRLETSYGGFLVEPLEISVADLRSLGLNLGGEFTLRILTPMILSTKIMMPPSLRAGRRIPSMHKLIPSASYIMAYLTRLWNSNTPPSLTLPRPYADEWSPYRVGRIADLVLAEVNHSLRVVTAIYDKKRNKMRKIRGVVGWIHYKTLHPKPTKTFSKLLALAEYMGVGRSRGIGMGQVKVIGKSKAS